MAKLKDDTVWTTTPAAPPDLSAVPGDLAFLLAAANYHGGPDAPHSEPARRAVDLCAERLAAVAGLALDIARERIKSKDAAALAAELDEQGAGLP